MSHFTVEKGCLYDNLPNPKKLLNVRYASEIGLGRRFLLKCNRKTKNITSFSSGAKNTGFDGDCRCTLMASLLPNSPPLDTKQVSMIALWSMEATP
jgi:hypothetical protein